MIRSSEVYRSALWSGSAGWFFHIRTGRERRGIRSRGRSDSHRAERESGCLRRHGFYNIFQLQHRMASCVENDRLAEELQCLPGYSVKGMNLREPGVVNSLRTKRQEPTAVEGNGLLPGRRWSQRGPTPLRPCASVYNLHKRAGGLPLCIFTASNFHRTSKRRREACNPMPKSSIPKIGCGFK